MNFKYIVKINIWKKISNSLNFRDICKKLLLHWNSLYVHVSTSVCDRRLSIVFVNTSLVFEMFDERTNQKVLSHRFWLVEISQSQFITNLGI